MARRGDHRQWWATPGFRRLEESLRESTREASRRIDDAVDAFAVAFPGLWARQVASDLMYRAASATWGDPESPLYSYSFSVLEGGRDSDKILVEGKINDFGPSSRTFVTFRESTPRVDLRAVVYSPPPGDVCDWSGDLAGLVWAKKSWAGARAVSCADDERA
jgi:hypothetical protein